MFAPRDDAPPPDVLAQTIAYLLSLPEGVRIHELVIRPVGNLRP